MLNAIPLCGWCITELFLKSVLFYILHYSVGCWLRYAVLVMQGRNGNDRGGGGGGGGNTPVTSDTCLSVCVCVLRKGKGKGLNTCYSTTYMSQTRDQQRFTVSEVAADWHEATVLQRIMWPSIG